MVCCILVNPHMMSQMLGADVYVIFKSFVEGKKKRVSCVLWMMNLTVVEIMCGLGKKGRVSCVL